MVSTSGQFEQKSKKTKRLLGSLKYIKLILIALALGSFSFAQVAAPKVSLDRASPALSVESCINCYYVDGVNGSDSNPGTQHQPWRTIQKAANTMVAGDATTVLAGSYDERIQVTRSGTSGAPIVFHAEGVVIMQGFTIHANYIQVSGFEITNTPDEWDDGIGIFVEGSNCDIEENYIHFATRGGILIYAEIGQESGTSNCIVRNNRLYRNAMMGIEVDGRNNLVEGNEIWGTIQYHPNWHNPPSWVDADGIRFFGTDHIVRGNYIHDITYADPENVDPHIDCFQTWAGIDREVGHNMIFEKNICFNLEVQTKDETGQGFMLEGDATHIIIRNNIIRAYRIVNAVNSPYLIIVNNTFINDLSLPIDYYPSIISLTGSPNALIKNNIMYDPAGHIVWTADDQSRQGLNVGYNCVYRSDGQYPSGSPYPHDLWQVNPFFIDADNGNFHLLPYSRALDAGTNFTFVLDDFEGNLRPQGLGYDIGIFEQTPVSFFSIYLPVTVR